jgi:hypothetical protein
MTEQPKKTGLDKDTVKINRDIHTHVKAKESLDAAKSKAKGEENKSNDKKNNPKK